MDNPYEKLFKEYLEELRPARHEAVQWWNALLASTGSDAEATHRVHLRWPYGVVSHPRIIAVYRKYFLACDAINEGRRKEREQNPPKAAGWGEEDPQDDIPAHMPPVGLLIDNLASVDVELSHVMEKLAFSPIGMNIDGETA